MSYYIYIKNDKYLNARYCVPEELYKSKQSFPTIEKAEEYARKAIKKIYDEYHDITKHPKLQKDYNVFRIWIADSEAIARDYLQEYVQKDWKPGMEFAIEHIVEKVKDIYPSSYISNKKAIIKKIKVEFTSSKEFLEFIQKNREYARKRSEEACQQRQNSLCYKVNNYKYINEIKKDLSMIKDEYSFIFPSKSINQILNSRNKFPKKGYNYILVHIKKDLDHKNFLDKMDSSFEIDFYEDFKDTESLNSVASAKGWSPIEIPEPFFYRTSYITKSMIKIALNEIGYFNIKTVA